MRLASFALLLATLAAYAETVSFNEHIRPILSDRCFACHGPDSASRKAGLRLDQEDAAKTALEADGLVPIAEGYPNKSHILRRITSQDPDEVMPPPEAKTSVTKEEIALLTSWIEQGAPWERHWAFISPSKAALSHNVNPVDHFILARLEEKGMKPAARASRERLLRRLSFDLTGLAPTLAEMDTFLAEDQASAWPKAINRLLESPAFGERLALEWLDIARYGDTDGLFEDHPRSIYLWRDWVVQAFNENLPYDKFLTWQLAGDLLPEPSVDQKLATGFLRNNATSNEGGLIDEDYRIKYLIDRVNTTSTAFLGLTMECAQCHDHKFDPMTQKEYYQFGGFFNNLVGRGNTKGATDPVLKFSTPEKDARLAEIKKSIGELGKPKKDTPEHQKLEAFKKEQREINTTIPVSMIASDSEKPRAMYVLLRGEYDKPGEEVEAVGPSSVMPYDESLPKNRLGLAQWMTDPNHPLTARVAVNRLWQMLFGTGLVKTSEDFGTQGERPSHHQLLDHLAVAFIDSGWDTKALIKQVVTSTAYQQSSVRTSANDQDPDNRLLARAPRQRLGAEFIRDHALATSGLLVTKSGGPGVRPYQPAELFGRNAIGAAGAKFAVGKGEDLYRRSLYTYWKRQIPAANMRLLGADGRIACRTRREQTNTPLQALVLLNDVQFTEAARVLAERMIQEGGDHLDARLSFAFRLATSRKPTKDELTILKAEFNDRYREFNGDEEMTNRYLTGGEHKTNKALDPAELASYAAVASMILNLDESISKS